ncbi:MAG: hypothetical protein IBX43_10635 [Campylobacterales bacterium]|nr:hypothetical protein [Campylobacterales bacterium]
MIRNIHPLYILSIMLLILFSLIVKNSDIENSIAQEHAERASMTMMAKRIESLRDVMKTPATSQIEKFLNTAQFSGAGLSYRVKNGRYVIESQGIDARQLQTLLNNVLNMSVSIAQLKMERIDDMQTSLYVEISL